MPIFEFKCAKCASKFEKLVLGANLNSVRCPKCGSAQVEKVFSTFATRSSSVSASSAAACLPGG